MTSYSERERDFEFMGWIKLQRCILADVEGAGPCTRGWCVEADHAGDRGYSQKSHDRETIPLCRKHHRDRTESDGYFRGWSKARKREWRHERIAEWQEKYRVRGRLGDGDIPF